MSSFLLIIAAFLPCLDAAAVTTQGNFYKNIGHDGKAFTENILFESPASSYRHCALLCNRQECCLTFTIGGGICRGHGMLGMFNTVPSVDDAGAETFSQNWEENQPKDCVEAQSSCNKSGVVTVYPDDVNTGLQVYCDHDTDGGGWLVFQRRKDGSVDFYKTWAEYQAGFGDAAGEFWLGLDALHMLTSSQSYDLRVDLMKFGGAEGYETYSGFTISNSSDNYRLRLDGHTGGNAGDSLFWHTEQQFSTWDSENDPDSVNNCAVKEHGAWWYRNCARSNLNGLYQDTRVWGSDGVMWYHFDNQYSLKSAEMKMRAMQGFLYAV